MSEGADFYPELALSRRPKLKVEAPTVWPHHRSGWKYVIGLIRDELHCEDGVTFISSVEDIIAEQVAIEQPWVGFVHQTPHNNLPYFPDLSRLIHAEAWLASKPYCRGLFVLSSYVKRYLIENEIGVPVNYVLYPSPPPDRVFSPLRFNESLRPKLLFIGEYLRNFQAFYDLVANGYEKALLRPEGFNENLFNTNNGQDVKIIDRVEDAEYDALLEQNIVFLNLLDAPANTTIIECMVRGTPVIVNKLEGVVEYLGADYPLYYENLNEASAILEDRPRILEAHKYLASRDVAERFSGSNFLKAFQNTAIYRSLPVPRSQLVAQDNSVPLNSDAYDVSLVICSYKRVFNIPNLLDRLVTQDFQGRFQIILWNNNLNAREAIETLYQRYKDKLDLTVIHSSENFYCAIRFAVVPLIHSQLMLICDDDVLPNPSYISTFLAKHLEYGNDAVLCCRGHVFRPHELDEENPHLFWDDYAQLQFFDETVDDRQVHFMHADNCLIPKHLMLKATEYDLGKSEYVLVDDYWLSFVFSHHLKVPIWKIKGDQIMTMIEAAEDPSIALFHNPLVREQRVNFYVEHMRRGWPHGTDGDAGPAVHVGERPDRSAEAPAEIWERGFHGANLYSEAHEQDLSAAAEYGVSVVRFGASGGARDFSYLVDEAGEEAALNEETIERLKKAVRRAARFGLNVILTLTRLPGRISVHEPDLRLWENERYQAAVVRMWGELAKELRGFHNIMAYDVINEPYLPDDIHLGYFDEMSSRSALGLNRFYARIIDEIRRFDSDTTIILESSYWASPLTIGFLEPSSDPNVAYSFHMYAPHVYTDRARNLGKLRYPGMIPEYLVQDWVECQYWDRNKLASILDYVSDWQRDHGIPAHRIYVGEFGVGREVPGAEEYLADLVSLFAEKGWSWTAYAFREDAWDAMDYELGPDINNMLDRRSAPSLFQAIARHFK